MLFLKTAMNTVNHQISENTFYIKLLTVKCSNVVPSLQTGKTLNNDLCKGTVHRSVI